MSKKAKSQIIQSKLQEIRDFCLAHADPARVQKYARYFVEGYDAYGIEPKLYEEQRDRWIKEFARDLDFDGFLTLGEALLKNGKYEEASFAIGFAAAFPEEYSSTVLERLGHWLEEGGFRNWAHTDVFCGMVLRQFFATKKTKLEEFSSWRESSSKWKRRAVPVSLIEALRAGYGIPPLLQFIVPLMMDQEKVVHQGLGWFLREAWKREAEPVEKLLLQWKDRCPRLIVQYATEKLTSEEKQKYRRKSKS
jgi:3-methyladenine DNA glycosylase AlkD